MRIVRLLLVHRLRCVMSDDYFDGCSDADFLALAQQIESREQPGTTGLNRGGPSSGGSTQAQSAGARAPATPKSATPSGETGTSRPGTSTAGEKAPRILRLGFNAIIVNTRQVTMSLKNPVNS